MTLYHSIEGCPYCSTHDHRYGVRLTPVFGEVKVRDHYRHRRHLTADMHYKCPDCGAEYIPVTLKRVDVEEES